MQVAYGSPTLAKVSQQSIEATLRYSIFIDGICVPKASSTGKLYVTNTCTINDSRIIQATTTISMEKRTLLFFWDQVDIEKTNDEWDAYGNNGYFSKAHFAQMSAYLPIYRAIWRVQGKLCVGAY